MTFGALVFLTRFCSLAEAAVPPEVPQVRNYSVFSPYEFQAPGGDFYGLNVVTAGGPACQDYVERFDFRQTGAPSTSRPPFANLGNYLEMLREQSGILFSPSHGGSLGGFYIEAYSTLAAAELAASAYIGSMGSANEIQATAVGGGAFGVRVSAGWVQRMLREASQEGLEPRHDIAVQVACNSYNANVAFVNKEHLTRNFAGLLGLCPIDTDPTYYHQISSAIFNTMSGIKADPSGVYRNAPFITGVGIAQGLLAPANPTPTFRSTKDTLMPLADLMRLYNAPRIVLSDVDQDSDFNGSYDRELYRYNPYPTYPYGSGTMPYPGPTAVSGQISNSSGSLRINLVFSESMDVSSFTARLRYADGSTQAVSGSWGSYDVTPLI